MSFTAYARFTEVKPPPPKASEPVKEMFTTGQADGVAVDNEPPAHKSDQGWFRVLAVDYSIEAPIAQASGQATGNVTHTTAKLIKWAGPLTPLIAQAIATRAPFNVELDLLDRTGQKEDVIAYHVTFQTCVFSSYRLITGDPSLHSGGSSLTGGNGSRALTDIYAASDTRELEQVIFTYQAFDAKWNTEKTKIGKFKLKG